MVSDQSVCDQTICVETICVETMANTYRNVSEILSAYGRRDAQRRLLEGALALALIVGLAVAFLVVVDAMLRPPAGVRLTLLVAAIATAVVAARALALRAARTPTPGVLAVEIESRTPGPALSPA